jgi:hypothetical protein
MFFPMQTEEEKNMIVNESCLRREIGAFNAVVNF